MKRSSPVLLSLVAGLAVAACSTTAGIPASPSALMPASSQPTVPDSAPTDTDNVALPSAADPSAPPEPPEPSATEPTVTYDWAVPWDGVTIPHAVHAPIAPAPALPLPDLVAVEVTDHPEPSPLTGYQRISFHFRGAFPEYTISYVPSLIAEGSGATIPLEGNAVLQVRFASAQAHDNAGESTVKATPTNPIGLQNLKSYGFAGDYEGYVTFGLGIQVAPDSDQVLQVRASELRQPDSAGEMHYVVHVDVQNG